VKRTTTIASEWNIVFIELFFYLKSLSQRVFQNIVGNII
jgi:hypothetical protein